MACIHELTRRCRGVKHSLTGAGSRWNNAQHFYVGTSGGHGTLTIADGAALITINQAEVGRYQGSVGYVRVIGDGSVWINRSSLEMGEDAQGTLVIADGGLVVSATTHNHTGGRIRGDGTLQSALDNDGLVAPGAPLGVLNVDGRGATYLPQVWEDLPKKEEFLSHLAQKAGLAPDAWRSPQARILVYQVESFKESER